MSTQKVAITVPKKLLRNVDALCREQGVSRSRYISEALQEKLINENNRSIKEAYDQVFSDESVQKEQLAPLNGVQTERH
jgi:metal-responsive CopG/Arc/MetJ family transcriptional regulator